MRRIRAVMGIRDSAHICLLMLAALAACGSEPEPSKCDLDALTELGRTLAPLSMAEQIERVWPGIMAACDDAAPTPLNNYFDPSSLGLVLPRGRSVWTVVLQRRACPRYEGIIRAHQHTPPQVRAHVIFEQCDFARYQVLTAEEIVGVSSSAIMTWATHQWLLDQGLDARAAAPVTRALYALDQTTMWEVELLDDVHAPEAHGVPFPGGLPIYVTPERIGLDARRDFSLADGELDNYFGFADDMREEAERELGSDPRAVLLIVGDVRAAMPSVLTVLGTGRRLGFERFGLFVAPEAYVPTHIPVTLARDELKLDPQQTPMLMSIELTPEGLTLGRGWNDRSDLQAHALDDVEAVVSFAESIREADPSAREVVLSVAGPVTLEQTIAVIEAARGPHCSASGDGCVLPEVVLRSKDAHRYPAVD